jgi:chromosome segregation ATPase
MKFDRLDKLIQMLVDELKNVSVEVNNLELKASEQTRLDESLSTKAKRNAEIEKRLIDLQHTVENRDKTVSERENTMEAKQAKIDQEWERMIAEKTKHDAERESLNKQKLIQESTAKELERVKTALTDERSAVNKQADGIQDMILMLKVKEERLQKDQEKVDKYLSNL